jgi:transcriptional regulator with XRE-family HTH domain
MAKRGRPVVHDEIVRRFADRLRQVRRSRGLTQAQLAERASVTPSYMTRLENATVAPGIDLADRLAVALGTTVADLLPTVSPPDALAVLEERAKELFENLLKKRDRETLLVLVPLLAQMGVAAELGR